MRSCHFPLAMCAAAGLVSGQQQLYGYSPGYQHYPSVPYYYHGPLVHTSRTTAGGEVKKAAQRALLGLAIFILAFPIIWFNEQRKAHMWKLFGRAAKMARKDVPSDTVNSDFDGRLVHMVNVTSTEEVLRDSIIAEISVTNCAKLRRDVEMYQWVETEHTEERDTRDGGKEKTTTYTYDQEWSSESVDASSFQDRSYENPPMPLKSASWEATAVSFGAFRLPQRLVGRLSLWTGVEGPGSLNVAGVGRPLSQTEPGKYSTMGQAQPSVGDVRISMEKVPCGDATVLALQNGDTFVPLEYGTEVAADGRAIRATGNKEPFLKNGGNDQDPENLLSGGEGCCSLIGKIVEANEEVYAISEQKETLKEMFTSVKQQESLIHLALMLLGYIMLVGGLDFLFQVVPAVFRFIPFVGTWIQFFGNIFVHAASFLLGSFCWLVTVALAWMWARPLKGVILLVLAGLVVAVPTMMASANHVNY